MRTDEPSSGPGLPKPGAETAARARLPRPVREQQMLDAATELFGAHGYHSVSMDQIAEAVGVSKPMLYAYFDSKEGLYAACLKRSGEQVVAAIGASYDTSYAPEEALWHGFVAFFKFVRDNRVSWQLVRNDTVSEVEQFRTLVNKIHSDLRGVIGELSRIASAQTAGDPFADEELREAAAYSVLGAAAALANRWADNGSCDAPPEKFADQLMQFFWMGFDNLAEGAMWRPERIGESSPSAESETSA